jgi:hypothetical protein
MNIKKNARDKLIEASTFSFRAKGYYSYKL